MTTIGTPLTIPELDLRPELPGGIELSENMQQVLALLTGFYRNKRVLVKVSSAGALIVASPQAKDLIYITATSADYSWVGENIECSEVMIIADPANTGRVWVRPNAVPGSANSWPLGAGASVKLGISNLNMINLKITVNTEKACVLYSI